MKECIIKFEKIILNTKNNSGEGVGVVAGTATATATAAPAPTVSAAAANTPTVAAVVAAAAMVAAAAAAPTVAATAAAAATGAGVAVAAAVLLPLGLLLLLLGLCVHPSSAYGYPSFPLVCPCAHHFPSAPTFVRACSRSFVPVVVAPVVLVVALLPLSPSSSWLSLPSWAIPWFVCVSNILLAYGCS